MILMYISNIKVRCLLVSDNRIFSCFPYYKPMQNVGGRGGPFCALEV